MTTENALIVDDHILGSIMLIRGVKVILDADLATLYRVPTKALVQAVKRNRIRFPKDFMLQLTDEEFANLRSQTVTSSSKLDELETRYDSNFQVVFEAIRALINPETVPKKRIGYLERRGPRGV